MFHIRNSFQSCLIYDFNQRYFDRYFLNGLTEQDWKEEVKYVQDKLSTSLLREAMMRMPANIFAIDGEQTLAVMIARKDKLETSAMDYYRFLAIRVEIPASDKKEHFEVKHLQVGAYKRHGHHYGVQLSSSRNERLDYPY